MKINVIAGGLLTAGVIGLFAAPAAMAGEYPQGTPHGSIPGVTKVHAGDLAAINGKCELERTGDYLDKVGSPKSPVIASAEFRAMSNVPGTNKANDADFAVTIKKDAKPGTYPVSFDCDGTAVKGTIQVLAKAEPTKKPAPTTTAKPQVETKPQGAPQTGGGAESDSSPAAAIALGGAGVAAAGGLGFFALRRRKNNA